MLVAAIKSASQKHPQGDARQTDAGKYHGRDYRSNRNTNNHNAQSLYSSASPSISAVVRSQSCRDAHDDNRSASQRCSLVLLPIRLRCTIQYSLYERAMYDSLLHPVASVNLPCEGVLRPAITLHDRRWRWISRQSALNAVELARAKRDG